MVPPSSLFAFYEEVIGIVSYTTGNCDEQGAAVFMDLAAFGRWINKTRKTSIDTLADTRPRQNCISSEV